MLNLVNQLFKVYFRINKLHLCKPLIRAIESSAFKESFPLAQQITYKYFVGRKAMFDSDYKSADEYLSYAFRKCPKQFPKNKQWVEPNTQIPMFFFQFMFGIFRLILIYLVPVKMLLGYMPKRNVLKRYDVLQFHELACALKEGNVQKFDEVIQRHESFFIECGIYLIVEKLKTIAYRNLFKRVSENFNCQIEIGRYLVMLMFCTHFRYGSLLNHISWISTIFSSLYNLLANRILQWTRHIASLPTWFMRDVSKATFHINTTNWLCQSKIHSQPSIWLHDSDH